MKISAGNLKGRKVGSRRLFRHGTAPEGLRPTSAKVREALFDILRAEIDGAVFLDLYAGSGAVGIEALSRGAARACFVENNPERAGELGTAIRKAALGETAMVYGEPVLGFLERAAKRGMTFDIIFADPPYASEEFMSVMLLIDSSCLLKKEGSFVLEHAAKKQPDTAGFQTLALLKNYKYGDTMLSRYRKVL